MKPEVFLGFLTHEALTRGLRCREIENPLTLPTVALLRKQKRGNLLPHTLDSEGFLCNFVPLVMFDDYHTLPPLPLA